MAVANGFNVRVAGLNLLDHLGKNKAFINVMLLIVAIQVLMTYIGGRVLRTAPLTVTGMDNGCRNFSDYDCGGPAAQDYTGPGLWTYGSYK
jgi:hypothetical protein